MNLSERGFRKIKAYEGYGRKLPDGSCTAYQERINGKLDIPTIGFGCTVDVKMGDVWTLEQAEAALRNEIAKHEAVVTRLVTVEINQNEYDALVSFDYNTGGLAKSTILKRLNAGDRDGAAKAFAQWNKFGGKPSKGLTARRADEAAMFLEPVGDVAPDYMPQDAEPAAQKPSRTAVAGAAATAATGAVSVVQTITPPSLEQAKAWKGFASEAAEMATWAFASPKAIGIIAVALLAVLVGPRVAPKLFGK